MTKQKKQATALIMLITVISIMSCRESVDKKIEMLQSDVSKHLPIKSSYLNVIDYLDRNGIQHSGYSEAQNSEERSLFGAPGRLDAVIRKVRTNLVSTTDIRLTFLFDEHGRMLSYQVAQSVKAP